MVKDCSVNAAEQSFFSMRLAICAYYAREYQLPRRGMRYTQQKQMQPH